MWKVLPGEFGFVAQLNEGRHSKKRPTEFRVDQVLQAYDPKKFNFSKVGQEEVLFCFEESKDEHYGYCDEMVVGKSPNIVAINVRKNLYFGSSGVINQDGIISCINFLIHFQVSPIEYGHVLLVPKLHDCKPQQIDEESFRLALHFAAEANNTSFRVGFNSLGAYATINHLHFQVILLVFQSHRRFQMIVPWSDNLCDTI